MGQDFTAINIFWVAAFTKYPGESRKWAFPMSVRQCHCHQSAPEKPFRQLLASPSLLGNTTVAQLFVQMPFRASVFLFVTE